MDAEDLLLREFLGIRTRDGDRGGGALDRLSAARRRDLGQLQRRRRRPVHDRRGLRRAAAGRRRAGRAAHGHGGRAGSGTGAASRPPGCSRASGSRSSASGPGTSCRSCRRSWSSCPKWFPLNMYDWGCWARQTIVPLTIVGSIQPVRPLPFSLDELDAAAGSGTAAWGRDERGGGPAPDAWGAVFRGLDRVLHRYERQAGHLRPRLRSGRRRYRRCADWILARQERDGCWGGIQPPWVYSLIALHLLGYGLDHPVIRARPRRAWTGSRSGRTARTARCAAWRHASRRSGTPCSP